MGLKENFRQAAKDLLLGEEATETQEAKMRTMRKMIEELEAEAAQKQAADTVERVPDEEIPSIPALSAPRRRTVIAAGTVIGGPITAESGLEIYGEVEGDVASQEDILVSGSLLGRSVSRSMVLRDGRMHGNIEASMGVVIDEDSIVLGDIRADELSVCGKVKGTLSIDNLISLDEHAVIEGDIVARRLSIAEGAIVQGKLCITSGNKDIFPDDILD